MVQLASDCDPVYEVRYHLRGVGAVTNRAAISSIEWNRTLDDISTASITHVLSDPDCCDDLARLEPWADTVTIRRNGEVVWFGWIQTVEYGRETVSVTAADALQWLKVRIPHAAYSETADQAYHFENFYHLAMDISPINANLEVFETGVVESREYKFDNVRLTWNIVAEMFETGLDVTVLGNTIYAGQLSIANVLNFTLRDFEGGVTITKDGRLFANAAWTDATAAIVGHYPDNPNFAGDGIYPLVEDTIIDEQLANQSSANAAAKARVDYSPKVPRIVQASDALVLRPSAPVTIRGLVPSAIVNLDSHGLCYGVVEQYRLGKVSVTVTGSEEKVSITLQPVGTLAKLQGYTDDAPTLPV